MKTLRYWYYGTMFLVLDSAWHTALHFSDNWEACQKLYSAGEHYLAKAEANRP